MLKIGMGNALVGATMRDSGKRIRALRGLGLILPIFGACGVAQAADNLPVKTPVQNHIDETFSAFADLDFRFSTWQGTRGSNVFAPERGKGTQYYAPLSLGLTYERAGAFRIETKAVTGYASAHHDTVGQEASIDTLVDTQVATTVTFLSPEVFQPFIGVALNLPTGRTYLPGNTRFTRMDPDLVEIGTYGMGLNVNPTVGLTFAPNGNTAVSLGVGYAWMGAFTREAVDLTTGIFDAMQLVKPGDTFTANGTISTAIQNLTIVGSFAFMAETDLLQNGAPVGRKGSRFVANAAAVYVINDRWNFEGNLSWSYLGRDKVTDPVLGSLVDELKNSNSDVFILSAQPNYMVTDRFKVGVNYSLLYRNANSYDVVQEQFVPAKLKQSAGVALAYAVTDKLKFDFRLAHFWVVQQDGPFLPVAFEQFGSPLQFVSEQMFQPPNLHYTGWSGGLAAHGRF
jgi:outer membrane putative beta-barrel porin/alpha-amylase